MRPTVLRVICVCMDLYGGSKDPAKTTQTKMALVERGLGARKVSAHHTQRDGNFDGALCGLGVRASREQLGVMRSMRHTYLSSPLSRSPRAPSLLSPS
jgi:hypothetical protein